MNLTIKELKEKIALEMDELEILEVLEITSSDLVDAFSDRIEERYEKFCEDLKCDDEL